MNWIEIAGGTVRGFGEKMRIHFLFFSVFEGRE